MYVRTYNIISGKKLRALHDPIQKYGTTYAIYMWTLLKHIVLVALARVDQIKYTEFK